MTPQSTVSFFSVFHFDHIPIKHLSRLVIRNLRLTLISVFPFHKSLHYQQQSLGNIISYFPPFYTKIYHVNNLYLILFSVFSPYKIRHYLSNLHSTGQSHIMKPSGPFPQATGHGCLIHTCLSKNNASSLSSRNNSYQHIILPLACRFPHYQCQASTNGFVNEYKFVKMKLMAIDDIDICSRVAGLSILFS